MAGENNIQILRGTRQAIANSSKKLQRGQPLYNTTDNYLTIGGTDDLTEEQSLNALPIAARELKGHTSDTSTGIIAPQEGEADWSINYEAGTGIKFNNTVKVLDETLESQNSNGTTDNLKDIIIDSAVMPGIQAVAFGGKSYRKLTDESKSPTSAEGPQSFAYGGSSHAYGGFSFAGGEDNNAHLGGSVAFGGGNQSGMTESEFNACWWNSVNNKPKNGGKGRLDQDGVTPIILDDQGYDYANSYSFTVSLGEVNRNKGRSSLAVGLSNTINSGSDKFNIAVGEQNVIGANGSSVHGSAVFGVGLKSTKPLKTVVGTYNKDEDSLFEVGWGKNNSQRANAFRVRNTGQVNTLGIINGTSNTLSDTSITTSLVSGDQNICRSSSSTVLGAHNTSVDKWCTHLIGRGLTAVSTNCSTVVGSYNDTKIGGYFSVGVGWGETNRITALSVGFSNGSYVRSYGNPVNEYDVLRKKDFSSTSSLGDIHVVNSLNTNTINNDLTITPESFKFSDQYTFQLNKLNDDNNPTTGEIIATREWVKNWTPDIDLNIENGVKGSIDQKDFIWSDPSYFDGKHYGTKSGDIVPGSKAKGFQSAAFGGYYAPYYGYHYIELEDKICYDVDIYNPNEITRVLRFRSYNLDGTQKILAEANIPGTQDFGAYINGITYKVNGQELAQGTIELTSIVTDKVYTAFKALSSTDTRNVTTAEGIQSFAAGGSANAYGDWSAAFNKDTKAYQRGSNAFGGGSKAGLTQNQFDALYRIIINNVSYPKYVSRYSSSDVNLSKNVAYVLNSNDIKENSVTYWNGSDASTSITINKDVAKNYPTVDGRQGLPYNLSWGFGFAAGEVTNALGRASFAANYSNEAKGMFSSAFGENNEANGDNSFVVGKNGFASGSVSFKAGEGGNAAGYITQVMGFNCDTGELSKNSFAGGQYSSVGVAYSYKSDGSKTLTNNPLNVNNSFTYGYSNKVLASTSVAFGNSNTAKGTSSFVVNNGNTASAIASSAFGGMTFAQNDRATTFGERTYSSRANQLVCGRYNIANSNALFIVGNGSWVDDNPAAGNINTKARKNIFEVLDSGRVTAGADAVNSNELVRKGQMDKAIADAAAEGGDCFIKKEHSETIDRTENTNIVESSSFKVLLDGQLFYFFYGSNKTPISTTIMPYVQKQTVYKEINTTTTNVYVKEISEDTKIKSITRQNKITEEINPSSSQETIQTNGLLVFDSYRYNSLSEYLVYISDQYGADLYYGLTEDRNLANAPFTLNQSSIDRFSISTASFVGASTHKTAVKTITDNYIID